AESGMAYPHCVMPRVRRCRAPRNNAQLWTGTDARAGVLTAGGIWSTKQEHSGWFITDARFAAPIFTKRQRFAAANFAALCRLSRAAGRKNWRIACRTTAGRNLRVNFCCRFRADAANGTGVLACRLSLDPAYPTPIAAPSGIGVSGAGEFARGIGQKGGNHMSVMASPSGQQIDIAASVRAAYQ